MANPWFRMYSEFATDPKVQMMSEAMQRRLTMLFCLNNSNALRNGSSNDEVAFMLRINDTELNETKSLFISKGFIDSDWNLLNWDKRQFTSDQDPTRAERQKRYREKHSNALRNAQITPLDTDTDTDTDTDNTSVSNDVANCPHEEIIKLYAEHLPMLTQVKIWSDARMKLLKARWREDTKRQSIDWWERFFKFIANSDFLTGKATDWQADIEWILNAKNFIKIIEGKYENKS